jgi:hypothetical protein
MTRVDDQVFCQHNINEEDSESLSKLQKVEYLEEDEGTFNLLIRTETMAQQDFLEDLT